MDRRDDALNKRDELTIDNVDEQIERLTHLPASHPSSRLPLTRTIRDLQRLYQEEQQLEDGWTRMSAHLVNTLEDASTAPAKNDYKHNQTWQGGKSMPERQIPESTDNINDTIEYRDTFELLPQSVEHQKYQLQQAPRHSRRTMTALLVAAVLLATFVSWMLFTTALRTTHTGSGGPEPKPASTAIPTPMPVTPTPMPLMPTPTPAGGLNGGPIPTPMPTPIPTGGPIATPTPVP